jgi:nicotinate-nucleotide pyrophosphorylase (carboxylating)
MAVKLDESLRQRILQFITEALAEDVGAGDFTSEATIPEDKRDTAKLLVKDVGILAGVEVARMIFEVVDPTMEFDQRMEDGAAIHEGDIAFYVTCNSRALLRAERLVLNTMQRMSGIATLANRYAFEVEDLPVKVLDTRKTTPNLRFLEKWAVRLGGAHNYRDGLYDRIMIKDNHIDAAGSLTGAIEGVQAFFEENALRLPITVEVRNLVELMEVLRVGQVDRIMLDNFEVPLLREAVAHVDGRFEVEASGGITLDCIREIAETGVDFISVGALTHSAIGLDMSLKVVYRYSPDRSTSTRTASGTR